MTDARYDVIVRNPGFCDEARLERGFAVTAPGGATLGRYFASTLGGTDVRLFPGSGCTFLPTSTVSFGAAGPGQTVQVDADGALLVRTPAGAEGVQTVTLSGFSGTCNLPNDWRRQFELVEYGFTVDPATKSLVTFRSGDPLAGFDDRTAIDGRGLTTASLSAVSDVEIFTQGGAS